ncbi:MAG: hypothetical protein WD229_04355 [Pirellulales bacterium]
MENVNPYASPLAAGGEAVAAAEQPLTLLGAFRAGTSLYLRRLPTIVALTLSIWVPAELFVSYQEYFVLDPDDVLGVFRWTALTEAVVGIIATGGIISVGEADLRGEHRGWLAGLVDGLRAWPRLFATRLLGGLVLICAAVFLLLPAIYLGVRYSLSDTAAVVERRAGMGALNRSMELTRGRFLVFFGLLVVTLVPLLIAGGVIFLPLLLFPEIDHWLVSAALTCVTDLLYSWMTLVFVAAYVQCRAEEPYT